MNRLQRQNYYTYKYKLLYIQIIIHTNYTYKLLYIQIIIHTKKLLYIQKYYTYKIYLTSDLGRGNIKMRDLSLRVISNMITWYDYMI